jgi:hypothetical protein
MQVSDYNRDSIIEEMDVISRVYANIDIKERLTEMVEEEFEKFEKAISPFTKPLGYLLRFGLTFGVMAPFSIVNSNNPKKTREYLELLYKNKKW